MNSLQHSNSFLEFEWERTHTRWVGLNKRKKCLHSLSEILTLVPNVHFHHLTSRNRELLVRQPWILHDMTRNICSILCWFNRWLNKNIFSCGCWWQMVWMGALGCVQHNMRARDSGAEAEVWLSPAWTWGQGLPWPWDKDGRLQH